MILGEKLLEIYKKQIMDRKMITADEFNELMDLSIDELLEKGYSMNDISTILLYKDMREAKKR